MKRMINTMWKRALGIALSFLPGLIFAQKAGDVISGVISDSEGPMMMVNVIEVDASDRIIAHAITDINGEFSFRLGNPKDMLKVSYVGYETVVLPFNKTYFDIVLKDFQALEEVVIKADRVTESTGLAIPEREVSGAAQRISMEEFEGLGITTVDEALQGRIAGLDIVFNSGDLGSGSTMHLRGVSTITGNVNPLIVVDGNVWNNDFKQDIDYATANQEQFAQLLNVNPEDISSITVLKDASSAGIWGAQGANGVIEIKTKRGSRGKTRVTFTYRLNGTWQPLGYNIMNGDQYTMYLKEAYFNPRMSDQASKIPEITYDPDFSEYHMYNDNTDWPSLVKNFGLQHSFNLAIQGGGEKANFRISAGFDTQDGSVIGQHLNRFTTRVALDYFISDRIKVVTDYNMTYTDNHQNQGQLLNSALKRMPNLSVYYEDDFGNDIEGQYYNMLKKSVSTDLQDMANEVNPVALAYLATNNSTSIQIQPRFQLVYNILGLENDQTKLTYNGDISFQVFNSTSEQFYPASLVTDGWDSSNNNKASTSTNKNMSLTTTHSLTFVPHFRNTNHSFMAMVRAQIQTSDNKSQSTEVYGLPTGTFRSTALPGTVSGFSTSAGQSRGVNAVFQAHYAYRGKYIVDFTSRTDGSTAFGDDKRWGTFPSVSLRWNISDEPFIRDNAPWITMLSIRPSWGINGRAPGGDALYYNYYTTTDAYLGNGGSIRPRDIRLTSLQWEESQQWNLGFDFGFFNDKLTFDVNLYTKMTTKMLMNNREIPTSSGYSNLRYSNEGKMRNTGWELNLNANRFVNIGKFSINGNITFSDNRNELVEMDPTILDGYNGDFEFNNGQYLTYVQLNNAFGSIYGFKCNGTYQYSDYSAVENPGVSGPDAPVARDANGDVILDRYGRTKPMMFGYGESSEYQFRGGDAKYEDINHDGNINELDIVYLGSSLPKLTGGFGLRFSYGRLSLNTQFNFRYGNKVINASRMNLESMYDNYNCSMAVNWRWRVEGDITEVPRALHQYGFNYLGSDRFIEDGSMIRLNYVQLSYSLDPKFTKNIGMQNVSLYVSMNNVFLLTKYSGPDPEISTGGYGLAQDNSPTPRSKSFTAGLTINF
ncbi:MAG: SusC/RagA family TonB-linked outer membrane protein [Bacteroidaceae bacterium]|nr:SusC/RagA family TonB-linked outer membrane protein [Bacteroidaceae bacterium]